MGLPMGVPKLAKMSLLSMLAPTLPGLAFLSLTRVLKIDCDGLACLKMA